MKTPRINDREPVGRPRQTYAAFLRRFRSIPVGETRTIPGFSPAMNSGLVVNLLESWPKQWTIRNGEAYRLCLVEECQVTRRGRKHP